MRHKMARWMLCTAALSAVLSAPVQAAQESGEAKAQDSSYYYNTDGMLVQEAKGADGERAETAESAEAEAAEASAQSDQGATASANETAAEPSPEELAEQAKQAEEDRLAKELFHLLNGQRVRAEKEAYQEETALYEAAKVRAAEIADCSEADVEANPRVIYDRPAAYPFAGTGQLLTSSITALDTSALPYYTAENGSLLVTELPVWRVYSTEAALEQVLEKNKRFLMDQFSNEAGEVTQYGFNAMGVACELRGSAAYYSIFIGAKNRIQ